MPKKKPITRYSAEKLKTMKSHTNWVKADALSQAEVENQADEDEGVLPKGWEKTVMMGVPPGKDAIKLRIDHDVLEWFRGTGKGYQTLINNVLRAFVLAQHNL